MSHEENLPDLRRPRGVAHVAFILLAGLGIGGGVIDFGLANADRFWLGALAGGRALIGVGVALLAIGAQHFARLVLARREAAQSSDGERPDVD